MRKLVVGVLFGFLAAATAAWALEVTFPTRSKAQARVIVDELGNVLFGAMPAKVEVTNLPASAGQGRLVVKDANGNVVGEVSPIEHDQPNKIFVVRDVGGVQVEFAVSQKGVIGGGGSLSYTQANCAGQQVFEAAVYGNYPHHNFYPPVVGDGSVPATTILFPDVVAAPISAVIQSSGSMVPGPSDCGSSNTTFIPPHTCCSNASFPATQLVVPVASLDVSQMAPPLRIDRE